MIAVVLLMKFHPEISEMDSSVNSLRPYHY